MTEMPLDVHCPVQAVPSPDLAEFEPLLQRLVDNGPLETDEVFPRGTLRADGRLDLCKQDAGVLGCAAVTRALQHNSTVHSLLLGTNGIGNEGASHVADLLQDHPLRTVYLGCNLIGADGTRALARTIRTQPGVRPLWLKRNPIGPEGARTLAQLLREGTSLRTLDVVHTGIGEEGARALLGALAEANTTLEHLYLSGNGLTGALLPELEAVLRGHTGLKGLYLSVNPLSEAVGVRLAEQLSASRLETLGLASCGLSDDACAALVRAAWTSGLRFLDLGSAPSTRILGGAGNRGGPETQMALEALTGTPTTLRVLNLPRLPNPERVTALHPAVQLRVVGHRSAQLRAELPAHPDALDIKSLYR